MEDLRKLRCVSVFILVLLFIKDVVFGGVKLVYKYRVVIDSKYLYWFDFFVILEIYFRYF